MANDKRTVTIHGKEYKPVSLRIEEFRADHPLPDGPLCIRTELVSIDADTVVMRSEIADMEGRILATGYAEEVRTNRGINATSALENCETSAIGRALAFAGFAGDEIASADEVANAINQQNNPKPPANGKVPATLEHHAGLRKRMHALGTQKYGDR